MPTYDIIENWRTLAGIILRYASTPDSRFPIDAFLLAIGMSYADCRAYEVNDLAEVLQAKMDRILSSRRVTEQMKSIKRKPRKGSEDESVIDQD